MSGGSLLKSEILCASLWDGDFSIMLPWMPEGNLLFLHFVIPTKGKIEGLFVVEKRLDMYDTRQNGYVQRLRLRPSTQQDIKKKAAPHPGPEG